MSKVILLIFIIVSLSGYTREGAAVFFDALGDVARQER
jgi:hypothetical protein